MAGNKHRKWPRRKLLTATGATAIGTPLVAGCTDSLELVNDGNDEETDERTCVEDYRLLDAELEERSIVYPDSDDPFLGFDLEVVPNTVTAHENFTVTLTNVSDSDLETYADDRIAIQHAVDGEWRPTVGVADDHEWSDRTTTHEPGDETAWEIDVSVSEPVLGTYEFCTMPTPGDHRAVFWGFPNEPDSDPLALATEFEIIEQQDDEEESR